MLDLQQLDKEKVVNGLEQYTTEFFMTREAEFRILTRYIKNDDSAGAVAITHNWKGFCAPFGFGYLGTLAGDLEAALKIKDLEATNLIVQKMEEYFESKK